MTRLGRRPLGEKLVERVEGSSLAKRRLATILETLSGKTPVDQACQRLGIRSTMFFKLRGAWLQGAACLLEPRPLGRPPRQDPADPRIAELEAEVQRLQVELRASRVREELARVLPRRRAKKKRL
jgi:hypothetical protein